MSEEKSKVLRSARVRAKGTKIQKDINKLDKLLDGLPSSFAQEIRSEVSRAGSKKDLNQTVQKLMKRASTQGRRTIPPCFLSILPQFPL